MTVLETPLSTTLSDTLTEAIEMVSGGSFESAIEDIAGKLVAYFQLYNTDTLSLSGDTVVSVSPVLGSGYTLIAPEPSAPEYDSTLRGGEGGVVSRTVDDGLRSNVSWIPGENGYTFGLVLRLDPYVSNSDFWSIGFDSVGRTSSRLIHSDVGRISLGQAENLTIPTIYNASVDGVTIIFIQVTSTSALTVSGITPEGVPFSSFFDPHDNFLVTDPRQTWLFDRGSSAGSVGAEYYEVLHTSEPLTSEEISNIQNKWIEEYF